MGAATRAREAATRDYERRLHEAFQRVGFLTAELEQAKAEWGALYESREGNIARLTTWHEALHKVMG